MGTDGDDGKLRQVYGFTEPSAVRDYYDDWADTYDRELVQNGYASPERVATALVAAVSDRSAPVLDYGCGTGLSGEALGEVGFTVVDGADPSTEMVRVAERKGVYRSLTVLDLESPPPFEDGSYGAIAAIGVIGPGAAPLSVFDLLVGLLAPGGVFGVSFNDHAMDDPAYPAAIDAALESGRVDVVFRERGPHLPGIGVQSTVLVLRRRG